MLPHVTALLHNKLHRRHEPFSIVHFVTSRCNARCDHCFIDFDNKSNNSAELTVGEIERLTDSMGHSLYNVNITGGEPFIREDLFDIVSCYVRNTPVRSIVITSNGWFTDAIRTFIERYRQLDTRCTVTFSLSIDNFEQQHDAGRHLAGLYSRAMASYHAVSACPDSRINADIALTVTVANAGAIIEIYHQLKQERVSKVSPILLREEGIHRLLADRETLAGAYRKLTELTDRHSETEQTGIIRAVHRAKNRISHRILYDTCRNPRFISFCRAGTLFASIGADGTVAPCEILAGKMPLGNLRDNNMDFLQIWKNNTTENARTIIRQTRCHCTFECAWTVNILTSPIHWPRLALNTLKELP